MIRYFVIFGASGDLTSRYLLPTLAQLHQAGKVPSEMKILGIAPETWDGNRVPEPLSTHPADETRIRQIRERLSEALCYYEKR